MMSPCNNIVEVRGIITILFRSLSYSQYVVSYPPISTVTGCLTRKRKEETVERYIHERPDTGRTRFVHLTNQLSLLNTQRLSRTTKALHACLVRSVHYTRSS